jgi:small subunit ribosomal protein S16
MPVKIRLSRQGKKGSAFYHIVAADSRAPRDGKFIERLGSYNPNTNPATIELNFDKAVTWLLDGAQPTETCRAILSLKGVMMKKHLLEGVRKGAFTAEVAEVRFGQWLTEKESKIEAKKSSLKRSKEDERRARLAAEAKIKEARAAEYAKKLAAQNAQAAEAEASAEDEGAQAPEVAAE